MPHTIFSLRLRQAMFCVICILVFVAVGLQSSLAQTPSRRLDPAPTTIEISGKEPLPPGVEATTKLGGGGGGDAYYVFAPANGHPYWESTPRVLYFFSDTSTEPKSAAAGASSFSNEAESDASSIYVSACGFGDAQPDAVLLLPDGSSVHLPDPLYSTELSAADHKRGCWQQGLKPNANRLLGQYKLQLISPDGVLETTWAVDIPECSLATTLRDGSYLLYTNTPNKTYSLLIYAATHTDDYDFLEFIAQRSLTADKDGLISVSLKLARSSRLTDDMIFFKWPDIDFVTSQHYMPCALMNWETLIGYPMFLVNVTKDGQPQLFSEPSDASQPITQLQPTQPVILLKHMAGLQTATGRWMVWSQVRTEDGKEGWLPANNLERFAKEILPGTRGIVNPTGTNDPLAGETQPLQQYLYSAPDENSSRVAPLAAGTTFTMLDSDSPPYGGGSAWWLIKTDDGTIGWAQDMFYADAGFEVVLQAFPWPPVPVDPADVAKAQQNSCPGAPPTQLSIGMRARIAHTDGTAANLRAEPTVESKVLAAVKELTDFEIIGGPSCGKNKFGETVLFWQVKLANGKVGWIVEARPNERVIEPAS